MVSAIDKVNNLKKVEGSKIIHITIITILCTIVLIPSFNNGFFGDDYCWLLQARESSTKNLGTIFFEPAPYEYFRPIPKIFFVLLWKLFPIPSIENESNTFYYRLFLLILHISITIALYELIKIKFNSLVAFITACIFSVIACHSETLYSINCLNELLSTLFILIGLILFLNSKEILSPKTLLSIFFFLLAVLSRESAFCFIPLIFLFDYKPKLSKQQKEKKHFVKKLFIIFVTISVYFILRFISIKYYAEIYSTGTYGAIDTNPLKYIYKVFHYFINIIFPVKSIFYIIGFENYENLRKAFLHPQENIKIFFILIALSVIILASIIYLIYLLIKSQKNKNDELLDSKYFIFLFPTLFILSSIVVYLPLDGTAERFLYLPSAGFCILVAILFVKLLKGYEKKYQKNVIVLLLIILMVIYTLSIYHRSSLWRNASLNTKDLINKVNTTITNKNTELQNKLPNTEKLSSKQVTNVLMLDIPTIEKGVYFVNQYNFNYIWKFYYPNQKVKFWFYNAPPNIEIDLIFSLKEPK
ncbi:MAG: hypothetical protein N2490_07545 [Ignavibacteria bacterium]|nr:hypothetical protein [Ignavibacteria bacterium]